MIAGEREERGRKFWLLGRQNGSGTMNKNKKKGKKNSTGLRGAER